ncbi:MAG: cytochrome c oxidase subunit II [Flavobacteriales bacterium]|nr:cytochrome c oxidase subunit II [Flavobacteriales bacterium]
MNSLLILIAVVAGVAAIIQLVRLNETASALRKEKTEEIVTDEENNFMAWGFLIFMFAFFGFTIWLMAKYGMGGLGPAASVHGEDTDWLLKLNYWIILPVFFFTNALLFVFAFKYKYNKNRRATYFSHSNKLELIWTVVPSTALAVIIFMGLKTWVNIMFTAPEEGNPMVVEAYAEQFQWTFRIAGENNNLGDADYKLICPAFEYVDDHGDTVKFGGNPMGIVTKETVLAKLAHIDQLVATLNSDLVKATGANGDFFEPDEIINAKMEQIEILNTLKYRIESGIWPTVMNDTSSTNLAGMDDIYVPNDIYLIKNRPVTFKFRSKDVIHSAWFPHFRAQMNCVPGLQTSFTFTPNYTTKEFAELPETQAHYKEINEIHSEMQKSLGEEVENVDFNFMLICNKICGAGHHNMKRNIIVVEEGEYEKWYECEDFKEVTPVTPRLDIMGRPVVYEGWNSTSDEKLINHTNMAVENASKTVEPEMEIVDPVVSIDSTMNAIDSSMITDAHAPEQP